MEQEISLLMTSPAAGLVAEIETRRPAWQVIPLIDSPPGTRLRGKTWCFVDWLCRSMSGLEMVRRLRETESTRHSRVTMVLEDLDSENRRRALQAGADDYMQGPLDISSLIARIENMEGSQQTVRRHLVNGPITLDPAAHQVRVRGKVLPLRPVELYLLTHFMSHPDQVFSRGALIERLGKDIEATDERTVDVWVGRLRKAFAGIGAADPLRTVRSLGYVMDTIEV